MRQQTFVNKVPTLYLVATPIGNLLEMSPRAIEILKNVALIACEDTRTSKILLDHFNIETKVSSYHKFNEKESVDRFLQILKEGKDLALISDAGYPLISDPGSILVAKAIEEGFNVTAISGSSAFLNALVASGFDLSTFTFVGFLSDKNVARKKQLEELKARKETLIFYEAPHRVEETINDMLMIFGEKRKAVLARELTKKFEEYIRGDLAYIKDNLQGVKGEIVLIVEGNKEKGEKISEEMLKSEIDSLIKKGISKKEIVAIICDKYDLKKNYVYDFVFK